MTAILRKTKVREGEVRAGNITLLLHLLDPGLVPALAVGQVPGLVPGLVRPARGRAGLDLPQGRVPPLALLLPVVAAAVTISVTILRAAITTGVSRRVERVTATVIVPVVPGVIMLHPLLLYL